MALRFRRLAREAWPHQKRSRRETPKDKDWSLSVYGASKRPRRVPRHRTLASCKSLREPLVNARHAEVLAQRVATMVMRVAVNGRKLPNRRAVARLCDLGLGLWLRTVHVFDHFPVRWRAFVEEYAGPSR